MTPVFGVICTVAGWGRLETGEQRRQMLVTQALNWVAFLLAITLFFSYGMQALLNPIAIPLVMLTFLALGTFVAGLELRIWRICAVGGVLFFAVPVFGWLKQSAPLLVLATLLVVLAGGLTWFIGQRREARP
ncbi:hypothetical protein F1189_24775 [Rhodovastum atsumiense]|uniref:Uncharacterized protein n=1 Tax=Rhodovastum atsumiense TaxID=504468 RepID=A0A5M6IP64_9PROT|nr:hypothetical protein F1189_24775 [Rhodovastum atsumiense]